MRPPGVETYAGIAPAGIGPARVAPAMVASAVARYFSVEAAALVGPGRTSNLALARHVAAYLLRTRCCLSFPEVGAWLQRDHTAVMYGVARVERDLASALRPVVEAVRNVEAALGVGHAETTDANWPSFRARLEGRCTSCDGRISPGQSICKSRSGWEHDPGRKGDGCPADPPEEAGVGDG